MTYLKTPKEVFISRQDISLNAVIRNINNRIFKFELNIQHPNDINMGDFEYIKNSIKERGWNLEKEILFDDRFDYIELWSVSILNEI